MARLHRHVREICLPYLPDLHTPTEDLVFFETQVFPRGVVWVAEAEEALVGYCAVREGWLDHLYVDPSRHGQGVGSALLARGKDGAGSLQLWTFQRNHRAQQFYERHGFTQVERTDGSGNEEREPDMRYLWRAAGA